MSEDAADPEAEKEAEEPSAIRRTLDFFVFAPVGIALTVVEDLPGLVRKGRERVETEIRNARVVGEFVVTQGQQGVAQRVGKTLHGDVAAPSAPMTEPSSASTPEEVHPPATSAPKPAPDPADGAIVEGALAGYDTLSASQVVRRLESLGPEQLKAVHRHEASHRNRRTILNRTNQLLEHGDGGGRDGVVPNDGLSTPHPERSAEAE